MSANYTITTDPSGNRLDQLNTIIYTNNKLKPTHNVSYNLRNNNGQTVSKNFVPYSSPRGYPRPGLLTCSTTDVLYVPDYIGYVCTLNTDTNILTSIPLQQKYLLTTHPYGVAFDSTGIIYLRI